MIIPDSVFEKVKDEMVLAEESSADKDGKLTKTLLCTFFIT